MCFKFFSVKRGTSGERSAEMMNIRENSRYSKTDRYQSSKSVKDKLTTNANSETKTNTSNSKLKCISLNARSRVNKLIELQLSINIEQSDILA